MREEIYAPVPAGGIAAAGILSDEEQAAVQLKLWQLLAKQTERYSLGDSSVRIETAQELLASVCFTLDAVLKTTGAAPGLLVTERLDVLFDRGLKIIEAKIAECKRLWQAACVSAPDIGNISYHDTLRSIGGFEKRYNYRFFAHHITCDIDYQLCHPVPESYQGVEYVNEYLRRVIAENVILRLFPHDLTIRLLKRYCPDYKGLLINLCEPLIVNALGLALIGGAPLSLQITDGDRLALVELFNSLPESNARAALTKGARCFCETAGIIDEFVQAYITHTAADLYPRVSAALASGDLSGIFISPD